LGDEKLLNPKIIELEGMAMTGYLVKVEQEDCDTPPGWKKLVAYDVEGNRHETGCMEPEAAKRNYMVFTLYIRKWGKMVNWDAPKGPKGEGKG